MRVSQLPGIDALILDEAHERSLNTDVLFATVKRLLTARRAAERRSRKGKGRATAASAAAAAAADGTGDGANGDGASGEGKGDGAGEAAHLGPRRVIIASATLDPAKLSGYFFGAPVLRVPGRCFPVQIFHASRPSGGSAALLEAAIELALRLHVEAGESDRDAESAQLATDGRALATRGEGSAGGGSGGGGGGGGGGGEGGAEGGAEGDILMFLTGQEEIETAAHAVRALADELSEEIAHLPRLEVLPLHATLPVEEQTRVFAPAVRGVRRLILATNIG